MRVFRDIYNAQGQFVRTDVVFDIMEATYTGQDMGKRSIMATIKYATPIDFQIGDYVQLQMQSLERVPGGNSGEIPADPADYERFYIYTEPQCKKIARPMSTGDAFETTVTFYPRQYELAGIQMRDFVQQEANAETLIYTGFDNVSFYGGAKELLDRCMACLKQYYKDDQGNGLWSYELADALNEDKNNALERYAFSFSGNSVMDALMKLNDKDYINTTFFINGRKIYVGFKRPFLCAVNAAGSIIDRPLDMMYGKTSHLPIDKTYGGLYDITKSVGEELPITKLFAYGAARNLNRYYCADRIQSGRFVNKLMLPSFSDDGETDWIISEDAVKKFGIREGSKTFEEIYPSLRYMTYADIRGIKYCIKVRYSGLSGDVFDEDGKMTHKNSNSAYPVARVQCYKVVPCTGIAGDGTVGCNKLVECPPPEDLAVFIHATGKTVKVLLFGSSLTDPYDAKEEACKKQLEHDGIIPTTDGNEPAADWSNCYAGACFAVHDVGFADMNGDTFDDTERANWFTAPFLRTLEYDPTYTPGTAQERAELHRIEYVDTFWLTDLYVMEYENGEAKYDDQRHFKRDGYSAWAWPRLNDQSNFPGSLPVNEVVAVEPVTIPDTSDNINGGRQQHFDIYLRDLGFAIDEQNDFGELVFVFSTPVVSVLDGILAGREFTIDGGENMNDFQNRVMCAYDEDGNFNQDFLMPGDSMDTKVAQQAYLNGAIWRIRLNRNDNDSEFSSVGLVIPNTVVNMSGGDHVVLLDIYMPDIYVRAAEQRLLREARNYLDKNDRGNIKYSINFDKVRFNQIQNYARQMREGLMLRMIDDDLNISSDNKTRTIVQHEVPLETQVPFYTISSQTSSHQQETTYKWESYNFRNVMTYNESQERLTIKIPRSMKTAEFISVSVHGSETTYGTTPQNQNAYAYDDDTWIIEFDCDYPLYSTLLHSYRTTVKIKELLYERTDSKVYPSEGAVLPAISKDYVNFKAGKYYEVVMQVQDEYWSDNEDAIVLSVSPLDTQTHYTIDDYECEIDEPVDGWRTVTYRFYLPDSFNDMQGYYIALNYLAPDNSGSDKIDYGAIRICTVTEKDLNAEGETVKYVDFKIAQLSIKIQDNTRPADSRIKDCYPEPIYEIQATIEEQTKASSWGSLMNEVEKTRIESETTKKTYEMLANVARTYYQQLLNLRNNIFDPDGTCNEVFLQTMMLQVGADSMNYQLDQTFTTPTGVMNNYNVSGRSVQGGTYDKFSVLNDDVLRHFVYTQGAQGGTWGVRGNFEATLSPIAGENNETIWPTYFVCIRCKKNTANDPTKVQWICSTDQYAVNQDRIPSTGATVNEYGENVSDYWYFNWGILTADSNGNYTLTETRGNAYMYGDNLVCGKISDIAKHSYFDLTHGNFVLSQGAVGDAAFSYINGVLTIGSINDEEGVGKIIKELGLQEIGGENLLDCANPLRITKDSNSLGVVLENGVKYVVSVQSSSGTTTDTYIRVRERVGTAGNYEYNLLGNMQSKQSTVQWLAIEGHGGELTLRCSTTQSDKYLDLVGVMLQKGDKPTAYNTYYKHLTNAIKNGSTEVAGGLLMTNLLMLKDDDGHVVAGMSGMPDTEDYTYEGEDYTSEGVTLWSGGSYNDALKQAAGLITQLSSLLPVLITKTGVRSRIGCFEVISNEEIKISSNVSGQYVIINASTGIHMYHDNKEVISISPNAVLEPSYYISTLSKDTSTKTVSRSSIMFYKTIGTLSVNVPANNEYVIGTVEGGNSFGAQIYFYSNNSRLSYGRLRFYNTTTGDYFDAPITFQGPIIGPWIDGRTVYSVQVDAGTRINLTAGAYRVDLVFNCSLTEDVEMHFDYQNTLNLYTDASSYNKIIIGNNGILCASTTGQYMLVNTKTTKGFLDIKFVGLTNTIQSGLGQLYRSNDGTLKIGTGTSS